MQTLILSLKNKQQTALTCPHMQYHHSPAHHSEHTDLCSHADTIQCKLFLYYCKLTKVTLLLITVHVVTTRK